MYLLQPSKILKAIAPSFLEWSLPPSDEEPAVYLTFDDGPHPVATPFVLAQLEEYNAQATFFCIGKNVIEYPHIYDALLKSGHSVGNHTHEHLNGWNTPVKRYLGDVQQAGQFIESRLFRPPYGKIKKGQAKLLNEAGYRIIMWNLLSADFDTEISPQRCLENVVFHLKPGDIVVFHDSQKAWERLSFTLPRVLTHCKQQNWSLKAL